MSQLNRLTLSAVKLHCMACSKFFVENTGKVPANLSVGEEFSWSEMCPGCFERGATREIIAFLAFDGTEQPRREYVIVTPVFVLETDDAPCLDLFRVEAASIDEASTTAVAIIGTNEWWENVCGLENAEDALVGQYRVLAPPLAPQAGMPLLRVMRDGERLVATAVTQPPLRPVA